MLEREIKFRISEEGGPDQIRVALERAGFRFEPSGAIKHEDRYLDTEDWLLHRAGIALRLRREGPALTLQAKTIVPKNACALARIEWSQPAPSKDPPWRRLPKGEVAALLQPLASLRVVSRLRVRARVVSEREVYRWSRRDETLGSATFDRVNGKRVHRAGGANGNRGRRAGDVDGNRTRRAGADEYRELELELDEGAPDALGEARTALEESLGVRPSAETKLSAALAAAGIDVPTLDERGYAAQGGDRLADVAVKTMGRQLSRLFWYEPGTRLGVDPEFVHDMRVATRRLRTALQVFSAAIPAKTRRNWQRELRWIGRALGRVRDCDVELVSVKRMTAKATEPERAALLIFANRLEIKRARRTAKLLSRLDSPRFTALKTLALPWIEMRADSSMVRDADAPAYIAGPRIVAEWDHRMLEACEVAEQDPTAVKVHALRIAIKHARYAVEYFADLEGPGAGRRAKRLGRLQNMLGARQDAAILLRHMKRYAETIPEEDRELVLGAQAAIGKIDRAARVRTSELRQVWVLGADLDPS